VRQDLLALAANLPSSASDVTKAAYQAISAGVQVSDVVPFLSEASKVAVGGATSLTSAVDLLTSATNAFRNQNLTAADAADSFFTAVKEGKTTIEEINAVFGRGAAMAQFGVSIDEMNAALAALTKQGMPTAEAMTRLQALVKTIANPVGQVAKGFKALGFEAGVSRLQNEGLIAVLSDLQEKTMGSTEILGTLTRRQEANSAALGLLGNNYRETIETFEAFSEKSGAAAAANDIMADTVSGLINRFSALKEDVLRRMGEEVLPLVNEALESFIRFLSVHGSELVNTVGSAAKTVMDFGKFIIANKDAIAAGIKAMFAVVAVQIFISTVAAAGTAFAGAMTTLAATGASAFMATLGGTLSALAAGGPTLKQQQSSKSQSPESRPGLHLLSLQRSAQGVRPAMQASRQKKSSAVKLRPVRRSCLQVKRARLLSATSR
jgi:TP901 family phage tail tape measure protein